VDTTSIYFTSLGKLYISILTQSIRLKLFTNHLFNAVKVHKNI